MKTKDLPLATNTWGFAEKAAIIKLVLKGQITMSSEVTRFEKDFASYVGSKHAIMVNSGSSANLLAATALQLLNHTDTRNEILVPTVSWSTTYFPWSQVGFTLKFVDVSIDDFNIDLTLLESAVSSNTIGICVVHLLGSALDMRKVNQIASDSKLFVVEDSCEAMGAHLGNKFAGTFGDIGTFSSYFSHHISTGEGGFLVTDNEEVAHYLISLRAHGWLRNLPNENKVAKKTGDSWLDMFRFYLPGYNFRPMDIQAAAGRVQLRKLNKFNENRRLNGIHFQQAIEEISWLKLQQHNKGSSWFAFGMMIDKESEVPRNKVLKVLDELGVQTRPIVTGNFTLNPVINRIKTINSQETFPVANLIEHNGFMVGNHPYDIRKKISQMFSALKEI